MKHLKIFTSIEEFEAAKPSMDTPYVVLAGTEIVHSNLPEISEDDLTAGDYIDLGLSVKWASCNLGATKPCEYGKYYQWGATVGYEGAEAKKHSDWTTSPFSNGSTSISYYYSIKDTVCPNGILAPEYDAVYQATNGAAHMPTEDQCHDLRWLPNEWCTCTFLGEDHESHTVYGIKFTGDNGNTLFIPAAGFFTCNMFYGEEDSINMWSASINLRDPMSAWYFYGDAGECEVDDCHIAEGQSVRGVKEY